jgi:hypothetical protein
MPKIRLGTASAGRLDGASLEAVCCASNGLLNTPAVITTVRAITTTGRTDSMTDFDIAPAGVLFGDELADSVRNDLDIRK